MAKPKMCDACYECKHRGPVHYSAHSSCEHPNASKGREAMEIENHPRGTEGGWFAWPVNFDPVWLENCNGFEAKEVVDNAS